MSPSQSSELNVPIRKSLALNDIRPYWRNPRDVSDEAVNAVAESIRQYGYQQPIVVDEENVIIIGHTRYAAMRRLGAEQVDVLEVNFLSTGQVKQLRVVDNRAAEYTTWNFQKLMDEVEGTDSSMLASLFPELIGSEDFEMVVDADADDWARVNSEVEFTCPRCFHGWEQNITRTDIFSGVIEGKES